MPDNETMSLRAVAHGRSEDQESEDDGRPRKRLKEVARKNPSISSPSTPSSSISSQQGPSRLTPPPVGAPTLDDHFVQTSVIVDCVHGCVEMEPVCMRLIDTPQFQRLRGLAQLGACPFVYPTANHNRFVHCIGTAKLAQDMIRNIQRRQPYLAISWQDIMAVKIAGLCHDLGHGPFSHLYDGPFMQQVRPDFKWTHEKASIDLFDRMLKVNKIDLASYGLSKRDEVFIKELIMGEGLGPDGKKIGRLPHEKKEFLYDIVNNVHSGLDVDKMDYVRRDSQMGNMKAASDFSLLLLSARVAPDLTDEDRTWRICFPEKLVTSVLDLFNTRFVLHERMYTHKTVMAIENMVVEVLCLANDHYFIPGRLKPDGTRALLKMSEAPEDMEAYEKLRDSVLDFIEMSPDPKLKPAQDLIHRIKVRDTFKCCGKAQLTDFASHECDTSGFYPCPSWCSGFPDESGFGIIKSPNEIAEDIAECADPSLGPLSAADLIAERYCIHRGKRQKNPVEQVRFYSKGARFNDGCFRVEPEKYPAAIPETFMETAIRVFVRDKEKEAPARAAFTEWCCRNKVTAPFPSVSQD